MLEQSLLVIPSKSIKSVQLAGVVQALVSFLEKARDMVPQRYYLVRELRQSMTFSVKMGALDHCNVRSTSMAVFTFSDPQRVLPDVHVA